MTRTEIEAALKYLLRVPARGIDEENELFSLILALSNALNSSEPVYTKSGKAAA